jgi:hypothetical protein
VIDLIARGLGQPATEPFVRERETDRLQAPQRLVMQIGPGVPQHRIAAAMLQHPGELIKISQLRIAPQQMPQRMQRRVGDRVGRMQARDAETVQFPALPALPKAIQTKRRQPLGARVP